MSEKSEQPAIRKNPKKDKMTHEIKCVFFCCKPYGSKAGGSYLEEADRSQMSARHIPSYKFF